MDDAIAALDGTHFDLAEPVRRVEAMIAPAGQRRGAVLHAAGAGLLPAGPHLAAHARPDPLPALGPRLDLVPRGRSRATTCSWRSGPTSPAQLSTYQTSLGSVGANVEGWALYAERLMDELGYLTDPGARLGYLDAQQLRAVRVVIDIGMHLQLPIPDDAEGALAEHRGQPWTPELARAFLGENSGADAAFLDSELVRYLGIPGQAISYKLGERAWLEGRAAAQQARGAAFDLKAWHMAALSQGSPRPRRPRRRARAALGGRRRVHGVDGHRIVRGRRARPRARRGRAARRCTPRCRRRRCSSGRCR